MLARRYDALLLDLDGTLYRGEQPVPHAAGALARLRELGIPICFVTNNSARTPDQVAAHLARVGVSAAPAEVVTSGWATARLLRERGVEAAFVIGEEGLRDALAVEGIRVHGGRPDRADVVVVGLDRTVDYAKLTTASLLVERGASLIATNADASFPEADGFWPGAGALLAAIEVTTGIRGEVVGKPHTPLLLAALARAGGSHPLVVGDRLDTDIAAACAAGWDSLLVLTGVSSREDIETTEFAPTYVADDLRALVRPE